MRDIDFLPDRIRAQRARKRRLVVQGYFLVLCIGGLVALGYAFNRLVRKARSEVVTLADRADSLQQQLVLRDSLEQQMSDLLIKKRIEEQLGRRVSTLDVLAELQRILPESMALTSLTMETVEVRVGGRTPAVRYVSDRAGVRDRRRVLKKAKRVKVVLTGLAPTDVDVANFIGQLSASPLFEDVNMGYARNLSFRSRVAREFQASCYVVR